ncbi:phosphatase PAP2 family protein [Candidatus Dojkabacteria bacterium]|uniref:Phosphatase PAP2 family protein n=1 Tax=Candidatus Dojkabacteria bacterium TaxID=2099670 RepID=A0A955L7J4_9BACT|nr:phosphatase PAP2 family protein [Candidatus Dojkabacteria bacterium]
MKQSVDTHKNKGTLKLLAIGISRIFDPIFLFPIAYFLIARYFSIRSIDIALLFAFQILPTVLFFLFHLKRGSIDFDITNRLNRIPLLAIALISTITTLYLLVLLKYTTIIYLHSILLFVVVLLFFITLYWKISIHMLVITLFCTLLGLFYDSLWYSLSIIFIPLVGWARIYLKKHTPLQVIAGSTLGGLSFLAIYIHYTA